MTFGEKLRKLRIERNLSQEELAHKLGVSRQTISRWELAEVVPDTANVLAVSRIFHVSVEYLVCDEYSSEQDTPAVRMAEEDLQQRQWAVGSGMLCRFMILAVPALYHLNIRMRGDTEMLPFLLILALLLGGWLAKLNWKLQQRINISRVIKELVVPDTLAVCFICFLPLFLDWVPGRYGILLSQIAMVPFVMKSWKALRRLYNLPGPPSK